MRAIRLLPSALLLALLCALPAAPEVSAAAKKKPPARARVKTPAKIDESTSPTRPRAKIDAAEKAAFRDAFIEGFAGNGRVDASLVAALASDLSDYYAIRQITADEVGRIRDALVSHLELPRASPGDLDGLVGRVNAVTEGSNLDMAEMENVSAAVRAVAESVRAEPEPAKKDEAKRDGKRRRGFFRKLFGR